MNERKATKVHVHPNALVFLSQPERTCGSLTPELIIIEASAVQALRSTVN